MIRLFFIYFTNQSFFLFLSAQVRPSITEEEVYFLQHILAIPLVCRSWKGPGTLDSLHAFYGNPYERLGKLPLKKERFLECFLGHLSFWAPLFLGKWYGVATFFLYKKNKRKTKYKIHDRIVLFID